MKTFEIKKNRPIKTLISEYSNKNSGKVSAARNEIKHRFDYLDWKDQKKIILLFLNSCPSDRQWIYPKMLNLWDESFCNDIASNWEAYHEERCSWVIVRHFPLQYLSEHIDELSFGRNYFFICKRFAQEKGFVVDRNKFISLCDYLSIKAERKEMISDNEAQAILVQLLQNEWENSKNLFGKVVIPRGEVVTAPNKEMINRTKNLLSELGKGDVVDKFNQWDVRVRNNIVNSDRYKDLIHTPISDYDYQREIIKLTVSYQKAHIDKFFPTDDVYSSYTLEELKKQNPDFNTFVESLDLELIDEN